MDRRTQISIVPGKRRQDSDRGRDRSTTLGLAVAVTDADKAPVGGGQTGAIAANVRHEFDSKPGATYQLQISPHYSGGGKYSVSIQ